jgi:KDO2-lipid IV(A) lauroyltransferase
MPVPAQSRPVAAQARPQARGCYSRAVRVPVALRPVAGVLVVALVRTVGVLTRVLPERASFAVGAAIVLTAWRCMPHWRATCERNLRIFYRGEELGADTPEARQQRDAIAQASALHLSRFAIEFLRMGHLPKARVLAMVVESRGEQYLREAWAAGQGAIGLGMHYGNWELCGAHIAAFNGPLYAVGKEQRDAALTRMAFSLRERFGVRNIPAGDKVNSTILRALKNGDVLGLSADQNGGKSGVLAPFAGTLASTPAGPGALALRTGAPLILVYCSRLSPGRLRFAALPPVDLSGIEGHDTATGRYTQAALVEATTRINAAYEGVIREDPTQWLWGHNRWKTRPAEEAHSS